VEQTQTLRKSDLFKSVKKAALLFLLDFVLRPLFRLCQ